MDVTLRCNALKCRKQLGEQALVTTCRLARPKAVPYIEKTCRSFFDSHIFCVECSKALDSLDASPANRNCPACETRLTNPDDAVVTQLNPSEDYKTSVLSGLSPTIIMECAGRGLAFYSYQATQEIIYQEYLTKNLTEKHSVLSAQMDQVIYDANSEIVGLRNKLSALQVDQDSLRAKHHELNTNYTDKVRGHARTQKKYDALKKQMLQHDVQSAAADAVETTISAAASGHDAYRQSKKNNDMYRHQIPPERRGFEGQYRRQDGGGDHLERMDWQQRGPAPSQNMGYQNSQRIFDTPARHRGGLPAGPVQQSRMTTGRGFHDGVGMQTLHSSQSSQPQRQPLGEISRNLVGSQNIHNTTFDTGGATTNQVGKVNLLNGRSGAPFYGRQV